MSSGIRQDSAGCPLVVSKVPSDGDPGGAEFDRGQIIDDIEGTEILLWLNPLSDAVGPTTSDVGKKG